MTNNDRLRAFLDALDRPARIVPPVRRRPWKQYALAAVLVALVILALWLAPPAGAQPPPCIAPVSEVGAPPAWGAARPNVARGGVERAMPSGGIAPKQ